MNTSPEKDERIMKIVSQVRRESPAGREPLLRRLCETDSLYQEIAETLKWEERMGAFLQKPLIALTAVGRPFRPGELLEGRFEIVRIIGEGGMGVVYEAIDRKRNMRIAMKSAKAGFQRLLSPELEGALKVRHPNVCLVNQIHTTKTEVGEVDFLSMEFLEGETLSAHLSKNGKLEPPAALEIARQLCAGVTEAHRSGIVHGDLKSNNVILCPDEAGHLRAVITDFGLASGANQTPSICGGTPDYMAPELWRGQRPSKASDIYALGVILYEIVTGRRPFESKSVEIMREFGLDTGTTKESSSDPPTAMGHRPKPPAPGTLAKGLDARWDRVILACLADSPQDRPPSAAQVIARLDKRPLRKSPLIAAALIVSAALTPNIRERVIDLFMPGHMRLAILPFQGPTDTTAIAEGALQDVSDRLRHLPSARRTLVVIPPEAEAKNGVETSERASKILHATHALQTSVRREGEDYVAEGAIIDLATQAHLRDFSARYSRVNIGALASVLAGEVSLALRLRSAAVPESLSPEATVPYDRGLYLLRTDRQTFEDAITLFREAARLDPRSPLPPAALVEAQVVKFLITKERDCLENAQRALHEAESLNPDSARVRLAAGSVNEAAGQHEKALEDFRRVQELEPHNVDAFLRIGKIYERLNMPEKAIASYREAIALDPNYYLPYQWLGAFYYYRGKHLQAAEQFQKAIDHAPGLYDAYTNLGAALDSMGREADAERALNRSLELKETAGALNSLGAVFAYERKDEEAAQKYQRALVLAPGNFIYWLNLGDSERRLGKPRKANAAYRKGHDLASAELRENPSRGRTRAFLAYFKARLGDRSGAEQHIVEAMHLSPEDNEVIRCAVLTFEALAQRENSLSALGKATPGMLRELSRHPDLADFQKDPRFTAMLVMNRTEVNY
jgi:eukaryotic-like serine/threonine-protein kinase